MEKYDVVVIGAGHNGLIAAAYLAKAGLNVCVLERQDKVGGGCVTREVTLPGFKHDLAATSHTGIQSNPLIEQDELGLIHKYGLKYIHPDPLFAIVFPDDKALVVYRDINKTCESIRQFSERDAEAYPRFVEASERIRVAAGVLGSSAPPPFGSMISFLEASEDGREYLRIIFSSAMDMAEEWFESEYMKVAIARRVAEIMVGPRERGTGSYAFRFAMFHNWPSGVPVGGAGALSEALAACIRDNGGTVRLSSPVKSIKVEAGEAKGVILDSGEEVIATKAFVSNLNVKQLFLEMLKPEELPTNFQEKVKRIKHSLFSALHQAIALSEAPKYKAGGDVDKAVLVIFTPLMEDLLRVFDGFSYGIPYTKMPFVHVPTLVDPSRAPEGKHSLYLYHFEPYSLRDGGPARWDEMKQEVADGVLKTEQERTLNLGPENILGRWIASPLDLERYNAAFVMGDIAHIGQSLSQFFANRPLPGWGHYRTPVKKLYMCGASTHPASGITGGGRAAVQVVMEDLGIEFKKVVAKK